MPIEGESYILCVESRVCEYETHAGKRKQGREGLFLPPFLCSPSPPLSPFSKTCVQTPPFPSSFHVFPLPACGKDDDCDECLHLEARDRGMPRYFSGRARLSEISLLRNDPPFVCPSFFPFPVVNLAGRSASYKAFCRGRGQRGGGLEVQLILHQDKCEFKLLWVWREREGGCRVGREGRNLKWKDKEGEKGGEKRKSMDEEYRIVQSCHFFKKNPLDKKACSKLLCSAC